MENVEGEGVYVSEKRGGLATGAERIRGVKNNRRSEI